MSPGRRIAIGLGACSGVLSLLALGQGVGLGKGYSLAPVGGEAADEPPAPALVHEAARMRPWVEYGQVLARPLFNESRAPEIEESSADSEAPPAQPLTLALTGVILTRDLQIALVTDPATNDTERVRVGQPLAGERAGWTLVELRPRAAVFEGAGLGRTELPIIVEPPGGAASPIAAVPVAPQPVPTPQPAPAAPAPAPAPGAAQAPGQPASAEEIRRRIEERRRQLREEAQKMLQQGNTQ